MTNLSAMDSCCLVCRSSEVEELISVSCVMSTAGRKSVREMIDIFVNIRASKLLLNNDQESHRLPDHVCDQCLARLDRAYRVWKASRWVSLIKKCDPGAEEQYRVCRICAKADALVSMFCLCTGRRVQIAAMVEYLVNLRVKPGDQLPPYICMDCLKDVNEGYGFKKDAIESIKFFREQSLHPWQKMQVRVDCPKRLVVEVSSEGEVGVVNGLTVVTCSVCALRIRSENPKRSCRGCRLEFRNYDEILRKVEEQCKVDEDDLMEVFEVIADYEEVENDDVMDLIKDEVLDDVFGDLMNDEMLVEVEKLPVKDEEDCVKKKDKKLTENKLVSVTTERPSSGDSAGKVEKKSNFITIQTIIEYKCCYAGCSQYGVVVDLKKHFQEAHPTFTPVSSSSPFKCPICGSCFPDENSLKSHYGKACPLYKCTGTLCPFVTRSHDCAMRHIKRGQNGGYLRHSYPKPIDLKHLGTYFVVDKPLDENSFTLKRLHERCCWCGELFMELHELEAHRELMHAVVKAPFQCETCNRPFDSLLSLSRHRSRGALRTHYYCKPCGKTFWEEPPFKLHKYTEHDTSADEANEAAQIHYNSEICCCGCEEVFASVEQLEEHRREEHPPEDVTIGQQFPCETCGKAFPVLKKLQAHLKKYQSGRLYRCLVLGCVFKTTMLALIKNHVTCGSHIDTEGKTMTIRRVNPSFYYCCVSRCTFEHSSYDEIVKHVASAHEEKRHRNSALYWDGPTSFRCEACFKNCGTEAAFLNHKNGRLKNNCRYCKITKLRSELEAHEANCPKRVEFVCEKCSQVFVGRYRYKLHMNSEHGVVIPHLRVNPKAPKVICTICGAMVRKPYLATHIQSKHENNRAFKCEHCDARFNAVSMKQMHMKNVHSTIKLYPCRQGCDKRYKHSGDRQRHEKLVHLGITPFVCAICSESFVRDRDLQLHSRKHTGRKLYCCDHCGADYDRLVDFREHQRGCGAAGGGFVVEGQDE